MSIGGATPAVEVAPGVHQIAVPTPFIVGRVNSYLFHGNPLTLLDTGPNTATSLDELERSLATIGVRIEDIGRVIISHQHVDHVGLAEIIRRRSGADIAMIEQLAPVIADWGAASDRDDLVGGALMRASGVTAEVLAAMSSVSRAYRAFGASVTCTQPLSDGSRIKIGHRTFDIMLKPGHSPSDTVFHCPDDGLLIGADHLLEHVSSNPLISAPLDLEADLSVRPRPLPEYLRNLTSTAELDVSLVLPGHGSPFRDHRSVIEKRFKMHDRRAARLLSALEDQPRTARELAFGLWGDLAATQTFLTLSEVVGHMDLLIDQGAVAELPADSSGTVRYTRS